RQAAERLAEQSHNSPRFKKNNQNQQRSVNEKMQLRERRNQLFVNQSVDDTADHRPPDRANAANDWHYQDGNANAKRENTLGMNEGGVLSVNAPGCSGERGGQGMGQQLGAKGVHSQVRSGFLIF